MITIRASEWRAWLGELEARLRHAAGSSAGLSAGAEGAGGFGQALRRELELAQSSRRRPTPLRDRRGRRLRASAYELGPEQASNRQRSRVAVAGAQLPTILKIGAVAAVAVFSFLGGSSAYINLTNGLPDVHAIAANPIPADTVIYAADGSEIADIHVSGVQHYDEPLANMGSLLPEAIVAVEDANFWHEPGFDVQGMARAAWVDWRNHQPVQGASTITQQLVKLRLTGNQVSVERKIKEVLLAVQVERTYSKQDILYEYLNTIHFGNNAQGSLAASEIYFHKATKDLDLAEASMLAGIPQSPLYNSPIAHWDTAKNRQLEVLKAMVRNGYITQAESDQAFAEDISQQNGHMFTPGPQVFADSGFVTWIQEQLEVQFGRTRTYGGGLRVYTTLNPTLQKIAENAVVNNVNNNRSKNVNQGAMVSLDPHTGAVVAMVGSADPNSHGGQYDMAIWPPRNPGSSMKIYNYTAAIESLKFTMVTPIADTALTIDQPGQAPWKVTNYDHTFHGTCELQKCMGNSLNIPAVKVEVSNGIDKVVDVARRMGGPPLYSPDHGATWYRNAPIDVYGASLTLGSYGETPLQMATGAATLASMGMYHQPFGIAKVTTADGQAVFQADPAQHQKQAVDPRVAFIMATIMSDNSNRTMIFGPNSPLILPDRRVAAKTGTTDVWTDAWTVGFTPSLASAFWFGNPDYSPMQQGFDAVYAAAPAWHAFMDQAEHAINADPRAWYGVPAGLNAVQQGGRTVYLMPGTSINQQAPPLPSWAHSSSSNPAKPNNQGRG